MKSEMKWMRAFALAVFAAYAALLCGFSFLPKTAFAEETRYCADVVYGGEGSSVEDNYYIYHDYKVVREKKNHPSAPSYGGTSLGQNDICAPVSGLNVTVFYDRYFPNLIPNFEPGMVSNGTYRYFPDVDWPQANAAVQELYDLMHTNDGAPGTLDTDFKNGLIEYFDDHGYTLSYGDFYESEDTVDLSALAAAVDQNKVGIIMCSAYNFVYGMMEVDNGAATYIVKSDANVGHIMMVYGYMIVDYYRDGAVFQSDTFLYVSSGYGMASQGYVLLSDYLSIDEALIANVS